MFFISVDANGEPVESRHYAARQLGFEIRVKVVVSEVRQISALCTDRLGHPDSFGNTQVGWMTGAKQRVEDKHFRAAQHLNDVVRYGLGIGDIGKRSDPVSEY